MSGIVIPSVAGGFEDRLVATGGSPRIDDKVGEACLAPTGVPYPVSPLGFKSAAGGKGEIKRDFLGNLIGSCYKNIPLSLFAKEGMTTSPDAFRHRRADEIKRRGGFKTRPYGAYILIMALGDRLWFTPSPPRPPSQREWI